MLDLNDLQRYCIVSVQVGEGNTQIIYTYNRLTWTDGVVPPPLDAPPSFMISGTKTVLLAAGACA